VDREALERGIAALGDLGYRVVLGESVGARQGYLAGSDDLRCRDVVRMFAAADVRAIFCARGGFGVTRWLPSLDPATLARHPKIFVGYSDVSPLLVTLVQRSGMVAFHGPMVAADLGWRAGGARSQVREDLTLAEGLDDGSRRQLLALLTGERGFELEVPRVVRPGSARGTLIGGCLSLLAATAGTPHALRGDGNILFLEDVAEPTYRIDRMLTQLQQSGAFAGVRGIVFGLMTGCGPDGAGIDRMSLIVGELAARLGVPVGAGLPSGHGRPNLTLPFGMEAELALDGPRGVLRVLDAAVS
jgi:muramoyltetrapeptide carboxypeptidase